MSRVERLRDRAIKQMKIILTFAEQITDATSLEAITTRSDNLENRYQAFNESEIELFESDTYVPVTETVDEIYFQARTLLAEATTLRSKATTVMPDLNATLEQFMGQQKTFYEGINTSKQVRLPKINIEPFSGDYKYWPSFHDLYVTTVHNNSSLSDVHKLQILNGLVKGDAASLIRHIGITEANYTEAWDKLCKRYNKLNPIVTSYIQSFFDQKACVHVNGKELRRIAENSDESIRGLRALGKDAEVRDPWLIHILLMKIDEESKQLWAIESVNKQFPTFDEFLKFLNLRCDALEICDATTKKAPNSAKSTTKTFVASSNNSVNDCIVCANPHGLYKCPTFINMPQESRMSTVIKNDLCHNCLRKGHTSNTCFSKSSCIICYKRHHTLLHQIPQSIIVPKSSSTTHHVFSNELLSTQVEEAISNQSDSTLHPSDTKQTKLDDIEQNLTLHTLYSAHDTILPTALVYVKSNTGKLQLARLLLVSGSQMSFVTESCIQNLGLKRSHACISIHGLASTTTGSTRGKTDMTLVSRVNQQFIINITAHIIKHITKLMPTKQHHLVQNQALMNLELADPDFHKHNMIDILVGADVFFDILSPERQKLPGLPALQNSKFGWIIAGTSGTKSSQGTNLHTVNNTTTLPDVQDDINQLLKRFWEVEEVPNQQHATPSESWCESYYLQTTTRDTSGRFTVRLPFEQSRSQLGNSWKTARQRLFAMEKRFKTSPEFFSLYKDFIHEYTALGHMTCISSSDIPSDDDSKYFIPHHAVMKATSSTTKLRVVFDASCKSSSSLSLNDILHIGPKLQRDLTTIVLRFQKPIIALVADIEKMYRQIKVNQTDANYQLILWRDNPTDPVTIYKLNTVTYGTACAPYLAVKTLQKSTADFQSRYPNACQIIHNDFYIDDVLTGCDTVEEALELKDQLCRTLGRSGFNLRKWKSNSSDFMQSFSRDEITTIPKLIEDDTSIKTLGIMWHADLDVFGFKVQQAKSNITWTKRSMLSEASKVYDPLGWLAPTIVLFKVILQKLWLLNADWDGNLPDNIIKSWRAIYDHMAHLEEIKIPRCLTTLKKPISLQLHAFCDASEAAYGIVLYLRAVDENGQITVNIVCAKGKVAPLKQISLPRLELCGAVLLCRLVKFSMQALDYKNIEIYAWTDSMIVLPWLSDVPRRWKSFVANSTSQILDIVPRSNWAHIETKQNPADHISRGVKPQVITKLQHWWQGPKWLSESEDSWPNTHKPAYNAVVDEVCLEERPKFVNVLIETSLPEDVTTQIIEKNSSWFKIKKIMAYILRFGKAIKARQLRQRGITISPIELNEAEIKILHNVQKISFKAELAIIQKGSCLPNKHFLSSLDPFIDSKGLLRVGGRLRNSPLNYSAKHPIILPKDHRVNELIIKDTHITNMHSGNSLVLSLLRQRYWMIGARYSIKRFIKKCTVCIRYRTMKTDQKMGDLPSARCSTTRPFLKTGLDYAGPIEVKTSKRRNAPAGKAYIAVFVCLTIKAVHLEVVSSLNTDSFLAALKRFIARRGIPEEIWCDNGSNFVGGDRELSKLKQLVVNQQQNILICEFLLQKSITFHFNPPRAPNFGGLWEATVKSVKFHLKRVTNSNFTFEEMTTLVIQIESLLNSRPLCKIDDDATNLQLLTPGHLYTSRWQDVQRRVQGFFKYWSRDYLSTLQHRYKWKTKGEELKVDDVVLIKEDNVYPGQWILGRVIMIHPGADNIVRVVTLKTAHNEVKRPTNKLIKLPVRDN